MVQAQKILAEGDGQANVRAKLGTAAGTRRRTRRTGGLGSVIGEISKLLEVAYYHLRSGTG